MSDFLERIARHHLGAIARKLIGEPNRSLSTKEELRFGTHGSLKVMVAGPHAGTWYSHELNEGGGLVDFLRVYADVAKEAVPGWLKREMGLDDDDDEPQQRSRIVQVYDYHDETDRMVFQVCRLEPKSFCQRRPDGHGGWVWKMAGIELIPYRLPDLILARERAAGQPWRVYIVEGEKDADRLRRDWGLVATCNPGGTGKWLGRWNRYFQGADIVIVPDNDDPGRKHAHEIAANFCKQQAGHFATIRIVELPGLPDKGDISDWMDDGGDQSTFEEIVDQTPPVTWRDLDTKRIAQLRAIQRFVSQEGDKIIRRPIEWLWRGHIARGKLSLLAGHPGLGKSTAALQITATLSRGGTWPDGTKAPKGRVLIMSVEDDASDTIAPRLDAADADPTMFTILETVVDAGKGGEPVSRAFSIGRDVQRLEEEIEALGDVVAVIIDPISAYLGSNGDGPDARLIDSNSQTDVRAILAPIQAMAQRWGVAVIGIAHLKKSPEGDAISLVSGSTAFVGAARAVFLILRDLDDPKRRLWLVAKNNLGPDRGGFAYRIHEKSLPTGPASYIEWENDPLDRTADEELAERRKRERATAKDGNKLRLEKDFLRAELAGPNLVPENALRECAKVGGFSWAKILAALNEIGAVRGPVERDLTGKVRVWGYRLG